jgi:hypothetical protein
MSQPRAVRGMTFDEWSRTRPPECAFCRTPHLAPCSPCVLDWVVGDDGYPVLIPNPQETI